MKVCLSRGRTHLRIHRLQSYGVPFEVDSTFASSYIQAPLELDADVVVHSTTDSLIGHSDLPGGAVITDDYGIFGNLAFLRRPDSETCSHRSTATSSREGARRCRNAIAPPPIR